MSEFAEALEGALAVIAGGIVLLMFASAISSTAFLNISVLAVLVIVLGLVLLIGVIVVGFLNVLGEIRCGATSCRPTRTGKLTMKKS